MISKRKSLWDGVWVHTIHKLLLLGKRWQVWDGNIVERSLQSVWLCLVPHSLSVFSLHGFVCRLSETFQESDSLLQPEKKDCPKTRVTAVIRLYLVLNIVGFNLIAIIQKKAEFPIGITGLPVFFLVAFFISIHFDNSRKVTECTEERSQVCSPCLLQQDIPDSFCLHLSASAFSWLTRFGRCFAAETDGNRSDCLLWCGRELDQLLHTVAVKTSLSSVLRKENRWHSTSWLPAVLFQLWLKTLM